MARPRAVEADRAIRDAARALLRELGYAGLTIEGVAARAGVAKTTVYRRWPSKAELVFEVGVHPSDLGPAPDTGSLAGDLAAVAAIIVRSLDRPVAAEALAGLVGDVRRDRALMATLVDRFIGSERAWMAAILERAARRRELAAAVDPALALDLLLGPLLTRAFFTGGSLDASLGRRVADAVHRSLTCSLEGPR
jgi:AcrR family transcriptional regulator